MKGMLVWPALAAFALSMILCPVAIPILHKLKFGQFIRELGPKEHQKKAGTPTMGGIMILIAFVLAVLICVNIHLDLKSIMLLFMTVGFGLVGFWDDYLKVVKKNNEGLKPLPKWLAQCVVAFVFCLYLGLAGYDTSLAIPFTSVRLELSWFYYVLAFFFIMAFVNGVNFTDGLDGLATSVTSVVVIFFMIAAFLAADPLTASSSAMLGALLGFLCYNVHPAKVFMGDTGSLALGGFVSAAALMLDMPLLLIIIGFVYVMEVVSVVLQVGYFKATHGKRIFRMAPIHHHFELGGWKETKVVGIFTIVTVLLCLLSLLAL